MRISLTARLFFVLGLIYPFHISMSALPEGFEGSAYNLDGSGSGSGSGSGDWSEQGEITHDVDYPNSNDWMFDSTHWPTKDTRSGYIILANSKSLLENKQLFAAIIAGGVTGGTLAAILTAILIYKWHNKDFGGYILGQQTHREGVI